MKLSVMDGLYAVVLANYLLESLDESIEPCEDLFKFACGTWLKNNRIPDHNLLQNYSFIQSPFLLSFPLKPVLKIHSTSYEISWITTLSVNVQSEFVQT